MDIKIKPLEEKYLDQAVKIAVEGDTGERKYIKQWLRNYAKYFVALIEDKVVGEIGWYQDNGRLLGKSLGKNFPKGKGIYWLSHFAVDETYRSMGIGAKLLSHIEKVVKKLGCKELWVYTDTARNFYEKNGFVFVQKAKIEGYSEDIFKKTFIIPLYYFWFWSG